MEKDQGEGKHESMTDTMTSSIYDDDEEPLTWQPANAGGNGVLELNTHCEYTALSTDVARNGFAVILHVRSPALSAAEARRTALDLVAVLDVSGSMAGAKLAQVKRALGFVVDSLGPSDRLSVVAFSGDARRVTRLTRMTEDGKAAAKRAVAALEASGGSTNVRAGLDEAANVIEGSRYRNDVAGVIFLSDCRDYTTSDPRVLVPEFFLCDGSWRTKPVHTFGLGPDVDAAAMHNIAEATGGTFSFVEDHAAVQDALAQCIGGLRSVTAQGVWIEVVTWFPGVRITAVKSGRYKSSIDGCSDSQYEATVSVGELYADEERRFLFLLDIPSLSLDDAGGIFTLIKVRCNYMDMATSQVLNVDFEEECAEVLRPDEATDVARCVEVERELLRVAAAEDMALAREAAERGAYGDAARILDARRESLSQSAPALSGDDAMCKAVAAELHELSQRVSDEREYRKTGRACLLAAMSSHAQQRASSVRLSRPLAAGRAQFGCVGSSVFATPAMRKMEKLSEMLRRQQEARPPPLPENGSKCVPPRSRLEARLASAVPRLSMLNRYRRLLLKR